VFLSVRSSKADQAGQGKPRVLLFPVLQSFAHTRHCRYINRRKCPSTPEEMRNTGNYFWLLRAVYSSTGGAWPREEATAEADTNREQQLCVSHSSPLMTTAMRASACQTDGENASSWLHLSMPPRCTYSAHGISL